MRLQKESTQDAVEFEYMNIIKVLYPHLTYNDWTLEMYTKRSKLPAYAIATDQETRTWRVVRIKYYTISW